MKRKIVCFLLFLGLYNNIYTQTLDDDYDDIDYYDFIGIYLSVEYMTILEKTKNYILSKQVNEFDNYYYQFLIVTSEAILYDSYSDESYRKVPVWDIMKYKFEYNNGYFVIDNYGNKYKKISDDIENWSDIHSNYITNTLMKELLDQGEIILNEYGFIIPSLNNKKFETMTQVYIFRENANLYLVDESNNYYVLEIKDNEYIIYIVDRRWNKSAIIWSKKLK